MLCMDPVSAVETFSTLVTGVEIASKIKVNRIKFIWNKYCRPRIRVLIYGDSGVGKTQFLNTLTGNNAYTVQRTRSVQKYFLTLSSGRVVEFLDTPGHQTAGVIRGETLDEMTRGKINGIINLVDYGYQDSDELQKNPDRAFNVDTKDVKESFLNENRKLEMSRTEEFVGRINPGVKIDWIITVINKADVWFSDKDDVLKHYTQGEYAKLLSSLVHSVKLYTLPFCSVITPFANREMRLVLSERDKKGMFEILVAHIESILP